MYDVVQSVKEKPLKRCPECKKHTLERVISAPTVFFKGEPTTLGQLAEKNAKSMGKTLIEEKEGKNKVGKKDALREAKTELNRKINKMSESQRQRYIENG
jgi:putative FmdB family regulatory protein